jgi:hypothetical protein
VRSMRDSLVPGMVGILRGVQGHLLARELIEEPIGHHELATRGTAFMERDVDDGLLVGLEDCAWNRG